MRVGPWLVWAVCWMALGCATARSVGAAPYSVDLSVEMITANIDIVAPGPEGSWWAVGMAPYDPDAESNSGFNAYRSTDEGRSWQPAADLTQALNAVQGDERSNHIDFIQWYSPEVAIVAGYIGPRVFRTTDGGRSWGAVTLPDDQWIYSLERSGSRTWMCGSSGRIVRSDDQGATWHELTATPFNDDDRCRGLSFLTPDHGWAVGMRATLWATEDGGESWTPLTSPVPPPRGEPADVFEWPASLTDVLRLTPELAWVQGSKGLYKTTDGGRTWTLEMDADSSALHVSITPDGRRVLTRTSPDLPLPQWIPSFEQAWALSSDTVLARGLILYVKGQLERGGPLRTQGNGQLTRLDGFIQQSPRLWKGWVGAVVVASHDEGRSWYRMGNTAGQPIHALAAPGDGSLFAELSRGRLLRSSDGGLSWRPAAQWDVYDFTVAEGRAPGSTTLVPSPESPLACLLSSSDAWLQVEYDSIGCFGGTQNALELSVQREGGHLRGGREEAYAGDPNAVRVDQRLERTAGEKMMRTLVEAATRAEQGPSCYSTARRAVRLKWSCGSGLFKTTGHAEFMGSSCAAFSEGPEPYGRAVGVFNAAWNVLEQASPQRPADVPGGAEKGATR
jgi:photosystem II stability/assembly factor-like uncharacterized protein